MRDKAASWWDTLGAMELLRSDRRPQWLVPLGVVAVLGYSWIAAGFRPFTAPEEVMVAIPALIVFAARGDRHARLADPSREDRLRYGSVWSS